MTIADHPLHRSGRAALPHPAPTLGDDAEAHERVRMADAGGREPVSKMGQSAIGRTTRSRSGFPVTSPPPVLRYLASSMAFATRSFFSITWVTTTVFPRNAGR